MLLQHAYNYELKTIPSGLFIVAVVYGLIVIVLLVVIQQVIVIIYNLPIKDHH